MNLLPSAEQRQFAASLDELLSASDVPTVVRRWRVGDHGPGRKLWQRLADVGVIGLLDSGGDLVDVVVAFERLGRYAVPGPLVESITVAPLLLADRPSIVSVSYGTALDADIADLVLIVDGDALSVGHWHGDPLSSVDPARRLFGVKPDRVVGTANPLAWEAGVLACAAQLWGAGSRALDMAVGYARQRVQFGRAIGGFQAVQHQLADVHVGLELARPLLYGAAVSGSQRDVSAAKVACGDAAYRAARVALQVHGAIGYTDEHDLGLWLTKIRALVGAWGTGSFHRARVLEALCG